MSETEALGAEFPFVQELPAGTVAEELKGGVAAFRRLVRQFEAAQARHGVLVPPTAVADALGVTPQRVNTLMDEGRFETVSIAGRRWITAQSAEAFIAAGPRPVGRPRKEGTLRQQLNHANELAAAVQGMG